MRETGKSRMFEALERWLPYPVYRFVGGPADGESRTVRLVETEAGMRAPEFVQVGQLPPVTITPKSQSMTLAECDAFMTVHNYRFVPTNRAHNAGHYEFVAS